jgi:hypothetical protein
MLNILNTNKFNIKFKIGKENIFYEIFCGIS